MFDLKKAVEKIDELKDKEEARRKGSLKGKSIREENVDNDYYNEENAMWATSDDATKAKMKRRVKELIRE
ncbi:hypothetical protein JCGZ_20279 [Jatropha curcas]|uniref:Uncharacterized protein n=1 Tax=Jatropha curcas TaxID=180498 RepID=A0A067JTY2_JATCU|nr:hypothetical protein JCGZ_20279 [Jatropha curcas]